MAASDPVSYTHLDVYKRQELARSSARRSARFLKAFPTMRFGRHIDILEELRERIHVRR